MNYTDLEEAIQNYCENSETTFVSHINDFIKGAEDAVFSALKGALFWKAEVNQSFVASTAEYAVASGAIDILDFYVTGADASTDGNTLEQVDHSFLREAFPLRTGVSTEGVPRYYALIEAQVVSDEPNVTVRVAPTPDDTYTYTISYYGKATTDSITDGNTPGTASTDTTWLSLSYPDVLLYGSLERAYIFLKGDQGEVGRYSSLFKEQLTLLKNMTEGRVATDDSTNMASIQSKGI